MGKTITGVLLDAHNASAKRACIRASLEGYYEALDCRFIEIPSRTIGGKRFDIICDEEGTFREDIRISALDHNYQPMLVGSLFVCRSENGELVSLSEAEIEHVLRYCCKVSTRNHPEGLMMITHMSY